MRRTLWHPDIHRNENERVHFIFIHSYVFFLRLGREIRSLADITSDRLSAYVLYGEYDVLLKLWCTDSTFARISNYLEKRMSDLAASSPVWLTASNVLILAFEQVRSLTGNHWLHHETLETMQAAQNDWENFSRRAEFERRGYCFTAGSIAPEQTVKAFIAVSLAGSDKSHFMESLIKDTGEAIFAVYETHGFADLLIEAEIEHGDCLWNFACKIPKTISMFYLSFYQKIGEPVCFVNGKNRFPSILDQ